MNHFIGIGRLTGGAELKYTASGTPVCKFSICINKTWKDKDGNRQEKPSFFNCVLWGKYGESMSKYLTKGKQIAIEAELEQNTWENKDGVKHNGTQLIINELFLLQSPKEKDGAEPP
jgi:single-strand DNA-binding protein